ncbi:MAG: TonB-dependent receptor [Muribaculaceae bacterium]|nr:TonB-dependent receptor [Muribaculaceae bacterium]
MRVLLIFIITLVCSASVSARTLAGLVYSDSTNTVVADAVCILYEGDKELSRTATGEDGIFRLQTDSEAALAVEIDKPGFSGTVVVVEAGSKNQDLGYIALSEASTLDELEVKGTEVVHSKGRTIVYPSEADLKASSTTLSLLQKLPLAGLFADPINRSLTVRNGAPMILINGIPATMSDVNSLKPGDIAKIEYSYITPARYADKGKNGFLSITLKEREDGGQVYLWGRSAVNTAFLDANLQASYHQGPSQFTLQYSPSWRNYQDAYDYSSMQYIGDDFKVDIEQHDRNPFNYHMHGVSLKYDFAPSERTVFSARFSATPTSSSNRIMGTMSDNILGEYDMRSRNSSRDFTPSLDMFLRHDFNAKNSLEVQVVGTLSSSDYRRDNNYNLNSDDDLQYINDINNRRRSLISEVSYVHNFDQSTSLSGGVQNSVSHNTNEYLGQNFKPVLTDNNNYIYARFAKQINRVYLTAASGAKMLWSRNNNIRRHYIRNMSSANITWYPNQKWTFEGVFSYSPSLPSLSALTNHEVQVSPYLWSNGNPDLKTSENFFYSIAGIYQHRKFSVVLQAAYNNIKNGVFNDVVYMGGGKFMSQSVNADKYTGMQGSLMLRVSDIYGFGANASIDLTRYDSRVGNWDYHLTSLFGRLNLWWNKGPWTISYYRKFPGKTLFGYNVSKQENGDALQVEFRPDKHWTLSAGWWYMFDKKGTRYPSWSHSPVNPAVNDRYIKDNGNMVCLSAIYTADFGALFKRNIRRSLNNNDSNNSLLKN